VSGTGTPDEAPLRAEGKRLAVVAGRWHGDIVDALLEGALKATAEAGAEADVLRVPGAFEIPVVAARAAASYDAVVALGVVMRGGTPHFDYVCRAVTDGCVRVSLDSGKPVGFGVLTVDDEHQARERLDKGREAVRAVLETLLTLDTIRS
jgi:6,7-dimethyl-8-ribityllumazine synthase